MSTITLFLQENIVLVYFVYGLAFFSMGLVVWLESGRASQLRLARALWALALFGLIHGLHEWLEMFQRLGRVVPGAPAVSQSLFVDSLRLGSLVISFLLLLVFGMRLIHSSGWGRGSERRFVLLSGGSLVLIWLISVVATQRFYRLCIADCLVSIDVLTRYILGIPASVLGAWAMYLEKRAFEERGMVRFGRDLRNAALALLLYGFAQIFVQKSVLFPSTVVNSELFIELTGIPIQLLRALMAATIAFFIIRALRAFEEEQHQQLAAANRARLDAQQQALLTEERAHRATEKLNQELRAVVQDLTLLFELSRNFATSLERDKLVNTALQKILDGIPRIQAGMILWREDEKEPLQVEARSGCQALVGNGLTGPVCEQLQKVGQLVVANGQPVVWCRGEMIVVDNEMLSREEGQGRILGVPLIVQGHVSGTLVLALGADRTPFSGQDLSLLRTIAGQLSMALENAHLYQEVQAREALRGQLYQRILAAQERERQRIARELHDGTGQVLTGLGLGLKAASETVKINPELASKQLVELKDLNARALRELRDLISDLRPSLLDDMGLVPAIQALVREFGERTSVDASFIVGGTRQRLPSSIETVAFRIAQEAMTNAAKHAAAEHLMVRLIFDDQAIQLIVTDDGQGFDPEEAMKATNEKRRAWGLLGIQERVTLVGGISEIASQPGIGTTVRVWIPLTEEEEANDEQIEDPLNVGG